jgi:Tol biopolymer transport system component
VRRLPVASSLLILGCQAPASSPPEARPPDSLEARACLAETHPILMHSVIRPFAHLLAASIDGQDSLILGEGGFMYGSVWAPDGRSIALRRKDYSMERQLIPTELVLLDPDSRQDVVLTVDDIPTLDGVVQRYTDGPSWSRDGREIAFAALGESGRWRIWAIARTGGPRRLLLPQLDASHFYPSWSPIDLNRLAYVSESEDGARDVWVVELGFGTEGRNLTQGRLSGIEAPRWSPDGTRLAISATGSMTTTDGAVERDIYLIDTASSELTRLTRGASSDLQPVWAPDGVNLLMTSAPSVPDGGADQLNLWQITLVGPKSLTSSSSAIIGSDWYPFVSCGVSFPSESR